MPRARPEPPSGQWTQAPARNAPVPFHGSVLAWRPVIGDNEDVVCLSCRQQQHQNCPGGTWCDCQHQPPPSAAEPRVGWIRQG